MDSTTENVIENLVGKLFDQHEKIDRDHSRTIKTGPRRGTVRYDDRYHHGYRDALEDVRMAIVGALRELRNPLGIHCASCSIDSPCEACAQQIAAEAAVQS
jgi:hypothetical protein